MRTSVLWVGAGIGVYGLASFAFLAVAGNTLGQSPGYTALALLWTLLNAIGIGLYLPVEQETSRAIAARRAVGRPTAPAVGAPLRYAGVSMVLVLLLAAVAREQLAEVLFEGQQRFVAAFVLALAGMAMAYLARGVLAGTGRFPRYGLQLGLDGGLRILGAGLLASRGITDALAYAAVLAAAPVLGTALAMVRPGRLLTSGPHVPGARVWIGSLVLASISSQLLANAGPVAAQVLREPGEDEVAGNLVNALTIARIPLFLFAAVQAVFLPRLAQHVAVGDRTPFVAALRTATVLTGAIGTLGVAATALVGPQAVTVVFGPTFAVGRGDIVVLALSAAVFMNAQVVVQGLLALGRDGAATVAWVVGLVGLLAALLVPLPLATRVSAALVVGSAAALGASSVALRQAMARW